MDGAAVPETAVDEDGNTLARENEIWVAAKTASRRLTPPVLRSARREDNRLMTSPAGDAVFAKEFRQRKLGLFVAASANP